jgi:small subunit ribosomal protein S7
MPRRGFIPKREVLPDPLYGTTIVTKLINQIMLDGKRGVAQSVCYKAFEQVSQKPAKKRRKFSIRR